MEDKRTKIRSLNDDLRTSGSGGLVMMTAGIQAKGGAFVVMAMNAVRAFDTFTDNNDPHGEHDFGSVEVEGERVLWKIDYYDETMMYGSDDPADPSRTTRVLTVMLGEEY